MGTVVDSALNELSGLAVSLRDPNVLWMHEDHAGDASIYAMNADGDTLAVVTLDGATNNDWENIATGPCGDDTCIFIGEIGNNDLDRSELGVYVLSEPDLTTIDDGVWTTTDWTFYGYTYPDGARSCLRAPGCPVRSTFEDLAARPGRDLLHNVVAAVWARLRERLAEAERSLPPHMVAWLTCELLGAPADPVLL